jgi:uncharacterized protein (TIGR03437 family)
LATVAGTGFPGYDRDGIAANTARLSKPAGIGFDRNGNLLIADTGNHRVRRVGADGVISTVAGNGQQGYCGDGGPAELACLDTPMDVKADSAGNIYVADTNNNRVRRIDASGVITTVASTGLNAPSALAVDSNDDVLVVDWQNYRIVKLSFGAVVNAASFGASVAPGGLISIFGSNLAGSLAQAESVPTPLELGGVRVEVNGTAIPLSVVSPGQINAQLPYGLAVGSASLVVLTDGRRAPIPLTVKTTAIGVFQWPGQSRAIAVNQDGTLNSAANTESRGRALVFYVTGLGEVSPPLAAGQPAPLDSLVYAVSTVTAKIGGVDAAVLFAGLAPGFVGVGQINVLVPEGAAPGDTQLVFESGGQASNAVTVSVR